MGSKTSTRKHQKEYATSLNDQNYDSKSIRTATISDQQRYITGKNVPHISSEEKPNFQKHSQLTTAYPKKQNGQQEKVYESSLNHKNHTKKTVRPNTNMEKQKLGLRKSQSFDNLSHRTAVVTAEQLLNRHVKHKHRNTSPSSEIIVQTFKGKTVEKSSLPPNFKTISSTISKKQISPNLQLALIQPNEFQNPREIGKGNFGTVYHALYKGTRDVALKTLNTQNESASASSFNNDDESIHELLYEANIMTQLKHPNLLRILGVTFFGDKKQLSLVTEFMRNGSLLDYLRKYREIFLKADPRNITTKLNEFGKQIFEAMLYLEERNIIHRDLAARNCLIGQDDSLKVGDFGLTTLTDCGLYKGTDRTVCAPRWTSPEALFSSKFSSRSDVWSYGITLWEMYSLGERPFGSISNFAVQVILKNSSENLNRHLPQPRFGSSEIYTHIILPCLTYSVAMRPCFRDLKERLSNILTEKD
ncbi:unnamed protein product [Rotaria magnacalcarata]|uniref:Protein kinase domain-containing protein n=1 Tax=Rotaria magnacalcarata TaxID=392030 RepID=A0A816QY66_9BILA|nr:unnamed protein product [Rotaria magnacalcarata]CAF1595054.1 unnamed protein product [Rotaria magnacalcarata]CAF2064592.1 unnamed protein product [Rotaria magnacalcarata]CAF2148411.1 unnamed protein product [Rotaria magnacalcarata]CAF2268770.1 unnamed protein product [Rotaria magnacalcarata]